MSDLKSQLEKTRKFVRKAREAHGERYLYTDTIYINARTKVAIICPIHGVFHKIPRKHLAGQGCDKCAFEHANDYRKIPLEEFIKRAKLSHGEKYDYSHVRHDRITDKVKIVCPIHGEFHQVAMSHLQGHGCGKCNINRNSGAYHRNHRYYRLTRDDFIAKCMAKHGNRYDYSESEYAGYQSRVMIICKKHGRFIQTASEHLRGKGCKVCAYEYLSDTNARTRAQFVELATKLHGARYDYSKVEYVNKNIKVLIVCPEHGEFQQTPHHHLRGQGCPVCQSSNFELDVENFIRGILPNCEIQTRRRDIIAPLEVDLFIPERKLGIEAHGVYWHSYGQTETFDERMRHFIKADAAQQCGIRLIQIFEHEWFGKQSIVESILLNKIGASRRLYARKMVVDVIDKSHAMDFYAANHLQGYRGGVHLGLTRGGVIYSMMSFIKHPKYKYELGRFANLLGHTVVGGASKLLAAFVSRFRPESLFSFADRRFSNGNLYERLGFKMVGATKPGYFYVKGLNVFNRGCFQKSKLAKKLQDFNPGTSESANMFANGYRRLWDAGHLRFLKDCFI